MSLEHFLDLFFRSNVLVVEVLFGVVLAGIIFLTVRSFTRPEEVGSAANFQGLEDGIKKILENYSPGVKSTQASSNDSGEGDGGLVDEMATQIERLKIQLMQKSEEVEQLKANVNSSQIDPTLLQESGATPVVASASASGGGSGSNPALEEKIKDLEARLVEYSIIEDDIADLSFYKEETVRLQAEIDKLKEKLAQYEPDAAMGASTSTVVTAAPVEVPTPTSTAAPTPASSSASTPTPSTTTATSIAEAAPAFQPAESASVDDDIMAEFERAVAEQKAVTANQKTATEVPPAPPEETADAPIESVEGSINLDKMLSEVGALPEQDSGEMLNVLEQALDTEKLLQEATGMDKVDTEALNEFDQFLKKEGA